MKTVKRNGKPRKTELEAVLDLLPLPEIPEIIQALQDDIDGWDGIHDPDNQELWVLKNVKCISTAIEYLRLIQEANLEFPTEPLPPQGKPRLKAVAALAEA